MSFLRDPLVRELLYNDAYDPTSRLLRPYHELAVRQPVRVGRVHHDHWPLVASGPTFDNALNELQSVMENVSDAIDHYQRHLTDLGTGGMKTTRAENGNLQMAFDVSQYKPEEVNVRICDDNLVVEGKTESSENDSYHKAEFKRWIKLPADVKQEAIKSTLTPDKRLLVEVPMNKPITENRSRSIPIEVQKPAVEGGDKKGNKQNQQQQQEKQTEVKQK